MSSSAAIKQRIAELKQHTTSNIEKSKTTKHKDSRVGSARRVELAPGSSSILHGLYTAMILEAATRGTYQNPTLAATNPN